MEAPSKIKYVTESIRLPFEPTMLDIMKVHTYFVDKYHDLVPESRDKFDSFICLEEMNERHVSGCPSCGDGSCPYMALTFCMPVENTDYDQEMTIWRSENAEQAAREDEILKSIRLRKVAEEARQAWLRLHRESRLARRALGRHLMDNHE